MSKTKKLAFASGRLRPRSNPEKSNDFKMLLDCFAVAMQPLANAISFVSGTCSEFPKEPLNKAKKSLTPPSCL
ncbi:MAG: hypothetical protein QM537_10225, partial [Candidatus Symbiobacter sp.]|nr:hypothetical protein [Candidatus Symbiobacter sp.]